MLVNQEVVFIIFIFVYEQKFEEYLNLKKKEKKKNWTEVLEFKNWSWRWSFLGPSILIYMGSNMFVNKIFFTLLFKRTYNDLTQMSITIDVIFLNQNFLFYISIGGGKY